MRKVRVKIFATVEREITIPYHFTEQDILNGNVSIHFHPKSDPSYQSEDLGIDKVLIKKVTFKPEVGMGATMAVGSDRYAGTIVDVRKNGKEVDFQHDKAYLIDGNLQSENQVYRFERNTNAPIRTYTLRKNGRYIAKGNSLKSHDRISIGHRDEFRDPHF